MISYGMQDNQMSSKCSWSFIVGIMQRVRVARLGRHPEWKLHHLFGSADRMVIYGLSVLSRINRECPHHSCGCGRQYSTVVLVREKGRR